MMQQNNIRRMTPFRRTNDYNVARTSMWRYLESPDRAVPTLSSKRHSSSPIVEIMESGSEAEFRCMFRLSLTVFAALVVELSPWITNGRSYNGDQNVTAEAKTAIALYCIAHSGNGFTLGVAAQLKKNIQCKEGTEGCRKRRADSSLGAGPVSKRQSQPFPDACDMSSFPAFGNLNEDMSFSAGLAGLAEASGDRVGSRVVHGSLRQLARREPRASRRSLTGLAPSGLSARRLRQPSLH